MNSYSIFYRAFLDSGEILECPSFKTLYNAVRFRLRLKDDVTKAVFQCHTPDFYYTTGEMNLNGAFFYGHKPLLF